MMSADLFTTLPEILLVLMAMAALMWGAWGPGARIAPVLLRLLAWAMILVGLGLLALGGDGAQTAFSGMFVDDFYARVVKMLVLVAAGLVLLVGEAHLGKQNLLKFEFPILVVLAVTGMMLMISAGNLIGLYMGLELQSLSLYVIAAFNRNSVRSTEAGLKYFVLGALASGLLLYGASLVYGFTGTTDFAGITQALAEGARSLGLVVGLVLILIGLAFKISAVPFHMWTPDVYQGSPTPVTAFFATAPKFAAMALIARIAFDAFGGMKIDWAPVLGVLAVLSMFVGAFAAIGQKDIKRLMAYSSIAHMGFALLGLAAGTEVGVEAMLFYMAIYVAMNLGTFAFILSMEREGQHITEIAALSNFAALAPGRALALLILLFSMAGVPPFLGFFAKLEVLKAAWQAGLTGLVIAGVIASVIGAFYYLRIVYLMYFGPETEPMESRMSPTARVVLTLSAAAMLLGAVSTFGFEDLLAAAARSLVQ